MTTTNYSLDGTFYFASERKCKQHAIFKQLMRDNTSSTVWCWSLIDARKAPSKVFFSPGEPWVLTIYRNPDT